MKYFAVSDTHDHFDLLKEALDREGFDETNENHKLIVCGDAFYSGPQPGEMFEYLKRLDDLGKLVFIYGNHDIELLDNIKEKSFGRAANRACAALLVKHLTGREGLSDEELFAECDRLGFTVFLQSAVPYFETGHYVFIHGFIPTVKKKYDSDWRSKLDSGTGTYGCTTADGMMLAMFYGISEPGKKIVFGHHSAARCWLMGRATPADWENKIYKSVAGVPLEGFRPYFGENFIAIDSTVKKSGFVNCVVIGD